MTPLERIAPAFIEMAHSIVWASVATVDENARPRTRILHPFWEWDGTDLFGWIATVPSPVKRAHLAVHPEMAVSYWTTTHDTCSAECLVEWYHDDETCAEVWNKFANGPAPVGYDPTIIPMWADGPTSDQFAALRLSPYRLRVMPGTAMMKGDRRNPQLDCDVNPTTTETVDVSALPLAPKNPLPLRQLVKLVRTLDTGQELIRDAGGPITRIKFVPKWIFPPIVAVMSPNGMRDVLGRSDESSERCIIHEEVRQMAGDSLFVLPNEQWRPRKRALQPVFTKQNVRNFGGHMSRAAQMFVDRWHDGGEVDLDVECRRVAMRSLGRSVLGIDLNERADTIAQCMHVASGYTADRALRPVRAPRWLPTPARRRAPCGGCGDAPGHRRDGAGVPCRSDPRCAAGAGVDRGHRSGDRTGRSRTRTSRTIC